MSPHIVCGVGVPHIPVFPRLVAQGDDDIAARYARVRRGLQRAEPSLLVVIATDHLHGYFIDRLPTFSLSLGDQISGPIEPVPELTERPLRTEPAAAAHLMTRMVADGFDLMHSWETKVDHTVCVPLHFLDVTGLATIVLNVNAFVPPLPSARRCLELGHALGRAVESLPGDHRVALVASGSFSQEVGGPRVDPGTSWSVPRPQWATRVSNLLAEGGAERVAREANPDQLTAAGSGAGELFGWLVLAGALDGRKPPLQVSIDHRPGEAYAYALWA